MRDSLRLGRIGGVLVGLNWSLLVVVTLLAYGLAENRFPLDAPGYSPAVYAAAGGVSALALIVGVLLHEFGHALVAKATGLRVDGITLSWMGGVTRIEGDSPTPRSEFTVAAAGPAVSLALGGLLWTAELAALHVGAGLLVVSALGWLAVINVALAGFNLLPAAPLDGGRVMHSIVWAVSGDRQRASKVAARAGLALGALTIGAGLVVLELGAGLLDGLILFLFGWWLMSAARAEVQLAALHRALDGLRVQDLMRPVGAAPGWITAQAFLDHYVTARPGWVWLLEAWDGTGRPGRFASVVAGDALGAIPAAQRALIRPADVGVPVDSVAAAGPDEQLLDAIGRTGGRQLILVVTGGRTVGAVLLDDIETFLRIGRAPEVSSAGRRLASQAARVSGS